MPRDLSEFYAKLNRLREEYNATITVFTVEDVASYLENVYPDWPEERNLETANKLWNRRLQQSVHMACVSAGIDAIQFNAEEE